MIGRPIDIAFVGSCTNGRLSDLQAAAEIIKGHKVAPTVKMWVVPGSMKIKVEAEQLGLDKIFKEAGAEWREAGCSLCLAMNPDKLKGRQVSSRGRRNEPIKGRSQNRNQEIFFNPAASAEELYLQVDKFVAAPPSGYSYPRGAAK